jgi:crotonobetainyl-CoA:carnitine CoA-transferase CaiB-like acyl-CoA transferase
MPFTSTRGPDRVHLQPAPLLGQHNRELLSELGLSDKDIDELQIRGVIGSAPAMYGTKV